MKLHELSGGYADAAKLLKVRLSRMRKELAAEEDPQKRTLLRYRIRYLGAILTQCYELQELTARYYERGYTRNEKYTL